MRKHIAFLTVWLASLYALADLPSGVTMPDLGDARVVVCAQNCRNYYAQDLTFANCDYHDVAGLEAKTAKMVNSFREMNADIFALTELEPNDSAISYLTIALNQDAGYVKYAYVKDEVQPGQYVTLKSGYIYRLDRVETVGNNVAVTGQGATYKARMRAQAFRELSSGETFVLSVNHFKAKSGSSDTQSTRNKNAENLISGLKRITTDEDKMIVGDLNETTAEEAVRKLVNAGYEEQMERFDAYAYSYTYQGRNELIDHALANPSMAEQVTGAGSMHINTHTRSNYQLKDRYWYSDHDPILVGLLLGSSPSGYSPIEHHPVLTLDEAERICTITGLDVTASRNHLPAGIYILIKGNNVQKISVR